MRILVDCSTAKVGGAKTYTQELIRALLKGPLAHRWILYTGLPDAAPIRSPSVEVRRLAGPWTNSLGHLVWLAFVLPALVRKERVDAVFAATGYGMLRPSCPQALMVRNPIYFSEIYRRQIRGIRPRIDLALRRRLSLWMIRSSKAVLFPTRGMAGLVERFVSLRESRASIAPYGCDAEFFRRPSGGSNWLPEPLARQKGRFLLNVSLYSSQKNFTVLFEALGVLKRQGRAPLLALTTHLSPASSTNYRKDRQILSQQRLEEAVVMLGPVQRERLPALYQAAGLFVFPSYAESFGHPLVEAMAAGLPILAADTPVNREVCGEAAVYAPAFDPREWAAQIARLTDRPEERRRLGEAALSRAARFTWEGHVAAVAQAIEEMVK